MTFINECKYCAKQFSGRTNRRIFCSDACKMRYNRENSLTCFYCGDLPGTRDHIMPHSTTSFKVRTWSKQDYVNCCKECNSILGNNYPYSMTKRVAYLCTAFSKKYKLDKPIIQWDEDELSDLSGSLARTIRAQTALWNRRKDRLNHMRLRLIHVSRVEEYQEDVDFEDISLDED